MANPRAQFRVLYRDFLTRLVDVEILSAAGDPQRLLVFFAALAGAFGCVMALALVPQYAFSRLPPAQLALAAWGHQEFLIASTMAAVGMFAVMAWGSIFPDRRDALILGTLPVRTRTIFKAKMAAVATGLAISVAAVNLATGVSYPFLVVPPGGGPAGALRSIAAYWTAMTAAGVFVFCALLGLQGIAAQFLSYRLFVRVSGFLQVAAFFAVLGAYLLTPGASELSVTAPENRGLIVRFPSFWFLGLFQELNGAVHPVFGPLARQAWWALSIAVAVALTTYVLAYRRHIRNIIEQPGITPAGRKRRSRRIGQSVIARLMPKPLDRAIVLFAARTLVRSRRHRAILAVYGGIGLAIALAYSKGFLYGGSRLYAPLRQYIGIPRWQEPNVPLLAAGFVLLFFAIIGVRAAFSLPAELKANWIFRVTAVHRPSTYFGAVRKTLYGLAAAPVWTAAAVIYWAIWPPAPAAAHMVVLLLVGVIVMERSLYEFRKIPFACSYLPGKAGFKQKVAIQGILFFALTDFGTRVEYAAFESRSRYVVLMAILVSLAIRAWKRRADFAAEPQERIQFEDVEPAEVAPLDLRRDGAWGRERYIDAGDLKPERPWKARVKSGLRKAAVAAAVALTIGALYEQWGQWRHRRSVPQIGRSVDIGGRSLNLFCSGEGGPTVIFESGAGGPGYAWVFVQREVSKFARACWYDRAGYGWSDSGPYPRHAASIAADLHALLRAAQVPPPYVLVGASFGGLCVRVFHGLYPREVAGMVLVDSSHFDERDTIPPFGEIEPSPFMLRAASIAAQVLRHVGALRVFMDRNTGSPPKGLTEREWRISNSFEPRTLAEHSKELFLESARQARAAGGLGDRPLIVLTAGLPNKGRNLFEARQAIARQRRWIEIQGQLARLSSRGRQVVLENSRHCITCDAPEKVIGAVYEVVTEARKDPAGGLHLFVKPREQLAAVKRD